MSTTKVLVGTTIALLLGFLTYKGIEKYLEVEDLDFGFGDDEIFGM